MRIRIQKAIDHLVLNLLIGPLGAVHHRIGPIAVDLAPLHDTNVALEREHPQDRALAQMIPQLEAFGVLERRVAVVVQMQVRQQVVEQVRRVAQIVVVALVAQLAHKQLSRRQLFHILVNRQFFVIPSKLERKNFLDLYNFKIFELKNNRFGLIYVWIYLHITILV